MNVGEDQDQGEDMEGHKLELETRMKLRVLQG